MQISHHRETAIKIKRFKGNIPKFANYIFKFGAAPHASQFNTMLKELAKCLAEETIPYPTRSLASMFSALVIHSLPSSYSTCMQQKMYTKQNAQKLMDILKNTKATRHELTPLSMGSAM